MNNDKKQERLQQLLIRWGLVVAPTVAIGYVTLRLVNFSYTALQTGIGAQTIYFAVGLTVAYSLYYYRARWLVSLVLLWLAYALLETIINRLPGEFDVFYTTARFQLYSTLFLFGWAFGFGLVRIRWSYIIIYGLLTVVTLVAVSDTVDISLTYILFHLAPVTVYGLYMFFLTTILSDTIELNSKKTRTLLVRTVLFVFLILAVFALTEQLFRSNLKAVEKELAARGAKGDKEQGASEEYDDRYGLMEKDDDGYRLKDTMRVNSRMSQSDKLMFCSKLDNFTDDGTPIPLYFVYHYLTRYDSVRETFTRDVNVPSFDEIDVDPTELPMFYSYTDTSIIRKSQADVMRNVVEAQVYLSENTWKHSVLGPASVFSIQTIPVEKDFQKTFLSAYKIYAYTSDLNNAYFVYNISASPQLEPLQEQRHEELRTVSDYKGLNNDFLDYYTAVPTGGIYDSITQLAHSLAGPDALPVDKVLAVRDFFLQRNENGKRVFRYTLKAGAVDDPNIPSSKMLYNFLFKTHAGYCTYYAGASHFMLRALGIPTRFTTGFATINRSDKNKGWYWFYASQAHAWTQVFFPGYGWLDFDMTIGNEDQQSAPKPDGTPPLPPPEPWLVLNAQAASVAPEKKFLDATFGELIFLNTPYQLKKPVTRSVDATLCRVLYDKKDTTFSAIQPGDSLIIVSYKDEAKKIPKQRPGISIEQQVNDFPSPIIADEIHIRPREKEKKKEETATKPSVEKEKKMTWQEMVATVTKALLALIVFLFLMPTLYLIYRLARISFARNTEARANQVYKATLYRLHMAGFERENETPLAYAQHKVDPVLQINFEVFMRLYLRLKYAVGSVRPGDAEIVAKLAASLGPALRQHKGVFKQSFNYLRLLRALRYFQQPQTLSNETPSL